MNVDSVGGSLGTEIVSALVVLILGVIAGAVGRAVVQRRSLRRLLDIRSTRPVRFVIGTPLFIDPKTDSTTEEQAVPLATLGTLLAYQRLSNLLARAYPQLGQVQVYAAPNFPAACYGDNLVLIGFPRTNRVTDVVLSRIQPPIVFHDHELVDTKTGKTWNAVVEGHQIVRDFGYILRARNPYNSRAVVLVVAGSQTYGMKVAADYLDPSNILELWNVKPTRCLRWVSGRFPFMIPERSRTREFQVVVSADVNDYFTSVPSMESYYPLR